MRWTARLSRAHIAIVVSGFLAFVLCFSYLQSLKSTISVAQLSKDVIAGTTISTQDITYVDVPEDKTISSNLITQSSLKHKKVVARTDLSKSDLLTKSNTIRKTVDTGLQSLSIGVEVHRANGGNIDKGDVVDIWETGENSRLVSAAISVRDVILPNKRLGVSTTQLVTIVVAVTQEQARDLSRIVGSNDLMIVLSNGIRTEADTSNLEEDQPFVPSDLSSGNTED